MQPISIGSISELCGPISIIFGFLESPARALAIPLLRSDFCPKTLSISHFENLSPGGAWFFWKWIQMDLLWNLLGS